MCFHCCAGETSDGDYFDDGIFDSHKSALFQQFWFVRNRPLTFSIHHETTEAQCSDIGQISTDFGKRINALPRNEDGG